MSRAVERDPDFEALLEEGKIDTTLIDQLERLSRPGRKNAEVAEGLEEGNGLRDVEPGYEGGCPLCTIPEYPASGGENILLEDRENGHYIVETEGKKGHQIRNMVSTYRCREIPGEEGWQQALDDLERITAGQIRSAYIDDPGDVELMVLMGSMNSVNNHFHAIGHDGYGTDLERINNFRPYIVTDEGHEPLEGFGEIRSILGEKLLLEEEDSGQEEYSIVLETSPDSSF